jgi:uncharacterized RDD family membrane protein YckC
MAANLVDVAVLVVAFGMTCLALLRVALLSSDVIDAIAVVAVQLVLINMYGPVLGGSPWQVTVGKRVMGIRKADMPDKRASFARAGVRCAAMAAILLTLSLGYFAILETLRLQGLDYLLPPTDVLWR